MMVGKFRGHPSSLCPHYETFLYEERFVNLFECSLVLADSRSYGVGTDRPALEILDNGPKDSV